MRGSWRVINSPYVIKKKEIEITYSVYVGTGWGVSEGAVVTNERGEEVGVVDHIDRKTNIGTVKLHKGFSVDNYGSIWTFGIKGKRR